MPGRYSGNAHGEGGVDLSFSSTEVGAAAAARARSSVGVAAAEAEGEGKGEGTGAVKSRAWCRASVLGAFPPASLTAASSSVWVWACLITVVGGIFPAATATSPAVAAEPAAAGVAGLCAAVAASAASPAARVAR